jgi:predicted thioesterase
MELAVGLRATVRHVVTEMDTAIEAGSGDVPVLATPRLLALAEAACVAALESQLDEGTTSVGTGVALEHRRPSPVGTEIEVEAELTELAGRKLVFGFVARHTRPGTGRPAGSDSDEDADVVVGGGTVERIVVDRAAFLARAGVPAGPGRPQTPVVERG